MKMTFKEYARSNVADYTYILNTVNAQSSVHKFGNKVEDLFYNLCLQSDISIVRASSKEDILFGYDFRLSWVEAGSHYSVMVDLTTRTKLGIEFYTYNGQTKSNYKDLFGGEFFSAAIGLKKMHSKRFFYHSPVYVVEADVKWVNLERYEAEFNFFLLSLKRLHMESAHPRRASQILYLQQ